MPTQPAEYRSISVFVKDLSLRVINAEKQQKELEAQQKQIEMKQAKTLFLKHTQTENLCFIM